MPSLMLGILCILVSVNSFDMKKLMYKVWSKFLTWFGNIKVFKFPMFLVYDPSDYTMDGKHIQEAMHILQPGDVVLRGYDHYLDGMFIDDPYKYSHGGLYVGNEKIVHAVAEGVSEIDAVDFMMCDRVCVLRPSRHRGEAVAKARKFAKDKVPYDFFFEKGASKLYCFELCAEVYPKLDVKRIEFKKLFGLLKRNAYLADSFRKNSNFHIVF